MIRTISWWELGLVAAVFLMSASELVQLWIARRRGLTRNVSRLVSHGLIMALLAGYGVYTVVWWSRLDVADVLARGARELPTANWTYLVLALAVGIVVSYEMLTVAHALGRGHTRNVSRILSHLVMLILLLVLASISLTKWELYLAAVEATYAEGIRGPAADGP